MMKKAHIKASKKPMKNGNGFTQKFSGKLRTWKIVSKIPLSFQSKQIAEAAKYKLESEHKDVKCSSISRRGKVFVIHCTTSHIVKYPEGITAAQIKNAFGAKHTNVHFTVTRHK